MKNLLPTTNPDTIDINNIRYLPGNPRSYRLDLGMGILNLEGREAITKPGDPFSVIPIAVRCLQGALFGQAEKKWYEVYFVNEAGHIGVFMFHGYSVQNLSMSMRKLFYEDYSLCEVLWVVKLQKKINKERQGYYMAFFDLHPLDPASLQKHQQLIRDIKAAYGHIYRSDTVAAKTLFTEHYSTHPDHLRVEEDLHPKEEHTTTFNAKVA